MTHARALLSAILLSTALLSVACKADPGDTDGTGGGSSGGTGGDSTTGATTDPTTGASATTGGSTADATSASGGSSGGSTGGGVACDPMNLPAEGSPCVTEGEICSPGCEDPCQFCNVLQCTSGTWQGLEVFPAQCLSCDDVCPFVLQAACAGGPPDLQTCVDGCAANQAACTIAFNQMLACIGTMPAFACDPMGRPTVAGCEMQFDALYACIMP